MEQSKPTQKELSERALQGLTDGRADRPQNAPSSNEGMVATPRENYPPSGAFESEGREPALRRSRER